MIKGGFESIDKSIEQTAMRELKEESCNVKYIK